MEGVPLPLSCSLLGTNQVWQLSTNQVQPLSIDQDLSSDLFVECTPDVTAVYIQSRSQPQPYTLSVLESTHLLLALKLAFRV